MDKYQVSLSSISQYSFYKRVVGNFDIQLVSIRDEYKWGRDIHHQFDWGL
jgi:hypothetical protein